MKVIDLLNKIANGEELPEIIKVMGATYYFCENDQSGCCYFSEKQGFGGVRLSFDTSVMNEKVEIIKEDKPSEEIRKLQSEIDILTNKVEQYYSEVVSFRDKTRYLKDKLKELGDNKE